MSFCRDLELDVLNNDGEGDHEDAHQKEEAIGDHIGQKHFTHCILSRCCLVSLLLMSSLNIKDSAAPFDSVRDSVLFTGSMECFLLVFNMKMTTGVFVRDVFVVVRDCTGYKGAKDKVPVKSTCNSNRG